MMIEKAITKLYNEIIQFIDSETDDIMAYGPILINNRDWSFGQLDSDFYSGLSGILWLCCKDFYQFIFYAIMDLLGTINLQVS